MVKVFIATPAFEGKTYVQYAISLAQTTLLLAQKFIGVEYKITTSGSLLCAERNRLIHDFMASDSTHMLCIDSDLGWPAQAVIEMLNKNVEFVAGCYPARKENSFLFRPVFLDNETGAVDTDIEKGLIKMNNIPAGFMLIARSAIQKMIDKFPELRFQPKDESHPVCYALFNTELVDGEFWGEDYIFCMRAREAGVDIWVDPRIEFDHAGKVGALIQVLSDKPTNKDNIS